MSVSTPNAPLPTSASPHAGMPELPPGPSLDTVRGPIIEPTFSTGQLAAIAFIGLVVAAFLLWHLIAYHRYRKTLKDALPPREIASQHIEQAQSLTEDRDFAAAHSEAFRNYLDAVLEIDVSSRTTAELSGELTTGLPINGGEIDAFLTDCDQVKFAGARLSEDQRIQLTDTANKIILKVEHTREKALQVEGVHK